VVVVVVMGLMVKGTRILVVDPPKSWLRVPQKVMPRNPDKLAYANCSNETLICVAFGHNLSISRSFPSD